MVYVLFRRTITAVRAVSDLADISVLPASIKSDTNICSAAQPCEALLTFSLRNITTQDPLLCVRLVRSGAGYTVSTTQHTGHEDHGTCT